MVEVEALVPGAMLLASKLQPPPERPEIVDRPRLVAVLAAKPAPALTLVVDQAGSGKTTLLAAWRRAAGAADTAWLALDRADNDPARFWTYVVAALRTARPGIGAGALASLRAPFADAVTVALARS